MSTTLVSRGPGGHPSAARRWLSDLTAAALLLFSGGTFVLSSAVLGGKLSVADLIAPEIPASTRHLACEEVRPLLQEGMDCFVIVSDSMRPYLKRGYSVIVRESHWGQVRVGDIVATAPCSDNPRGYLHQLLAVPDSALSLIRTKGTNNLTADSCGAIAADIRGVVVGVLY